MMTRSGKRPHSAIDSTTTSASHDSADADSSLLPSPPSGPPAPPALEVTDVRRRLREAQPSHVHRIDEGAPVFLKAALEWLTTSFVDAAVKETKRHRGEVDEEEGHTAKKEVACEDENGEDGVMQTIRSTDLASLFASHEEWRVMMLGGPAERLRGADEQPSMVTTPPPAAAQRDEDASATAIFRSLSRAHAAPPPLLPRCRPPPHSAALPPSPPPTQTTSTSPCRSAAATAVSEKVASEEDDAGGEGGGGQLAVDAKGSVERASGCGGVKEGAASASSDGPRKRRKRLIRSQGWAGGKLGSAVSCYVPSSHTNAPHRSAPLASSHNPYTA